MLSFFHIRRLYLRSFCYVINGHICVYLTLKHFHVRSFAMSSLRVTGFCFCPHNILLSNMGGVPGLCQYQDVVLQLKRVRLHHFIEITEIQPFSWYFHWRTR